MGMAASVDHLGSGTQWSQHPVTGKLGSDSSCERCFYEDDSLGGIAFGGAVRLSALSPVICRETAAPSFAAFPVNSGTLYPAVLGRAL